MTVYVMAQLKFTDRAAYDRYQARFFGVFSQFEGTLLAADEQPLVVEGEWQRDKVVLMSFPHAEAYPGVRRVTGLRGDLARPQSRRRRGRAGAARGACTQTILKLALPRATSRSPQTTRHSTNASVRPSFNTLGRTSSQSPMRAVSR